MSRFWKTTRSSRMFQLGLLWLLALLVGCSSGGSSGCDCAKPIPGGFPAAQKINNISQVAFTRKGFDFIEQNMGGLIKQFLPTGLDFEVPKTKSGNIEVCLNPPCKVKGNIRSVKMSLVPSQTIRADIKLDITSTKIKVRVTQKVIITIRKTCYIQATMKNKSVRADIKVSVDQRNQGLKLDVGAPQVSISNSDYKIDGDIICKGLNLIKGLFKSLIQKEVKNALQDAVGGLTCMTCKAQADCPSGSTCKSGKCVQGNSCLPIKMGMSGMASLGELLGGLGNPSSKELMFSVDIGGRAQVKTTGLELGGLGGTHTTQRHPCVSAKTFPKLTPPKPFVFPTKAPDGNTYMLGFALSEVMLTKAMQDVYNTGALCLRLDSSLSAQLGSFFSAQGLGGIVTPSIAKLVGKDDPPIYIAMRPTQAPKMVIGKGTMGKNAKGEDIIKEPLMELQIPQLAMDFYLFYQDRWIRLFTYKADLKIPLGMAVRPGNKLGLVLGDLTKAFSNPSVTNFNILKEDPKKVADGLYNRLKAVLPLATGSLGAQEFDLPDLQGFQIVLRGLAGQVPKAGNPKNFNYLGLFADLKIAPPTKPLLPAEPIDLTVAKVTYPTNLAARLKAREVLKEFPRVVLDVQDAREGREYAFRLNNGFWTRFKPGKRHVLESAQFLLQGQHKIRVRSRLASNPTAADSNFGEVKVTIDYDKPKVFVMPGINGIQTFVYDAATRNKELVTTTYRVNGGKWLNLPLGETIPTAHLAKGTTIEVQAKDARGLKSVTRYVWSGPTDPTASPYSGDLPVCCACQTQSSTPPLELNLLFLLALFAGIWNKRRRRV